MPSLPTAAAVPWTSIHTSRAASTVVANILASGALDEISNYPSEDGEESAIKGYLRNPREGPVFKSLPRKACSDVSLNCF
jgi:hypothetical protein